MEITILVSIIVLMITGFVAWNWNGLRMYRQRDVIDLYARIKVLEETANTNSVYMVTLEKELDSLRQLLYDFNSGEMGVKTKPSEEEVGGRVRIAFDTLLVCGGDVEICNLDRNALMRSGSEFRMLRGSTSGEFDAEIRRRRRDGTMYKNVHFAMHSDESGLLFEDGIVSGEWLADRLLGANIVFLAGCSSAKVADDISGVVEYVIVTYTDIENTLAADFVYNFWSSFVSGNTPEFSYREAIERTPQVKQYVDMRVG